MSEKPQPWLKWYPADWRADPPLRMCSLAARGLWIEMLGFMHEAELYGHLIIAGQRPTPDDLAALVGIAPATVRKALAELESRNVFSRTDDGTIYSRKMVRDKAKLERDRANGKRGGNPNVMTPDNDGVNPQDKAQNPEARNQEEGSVANATDAGASPAGTVLDLKRELWDRARALLGKHGIAKQQAGSLIGKWLKNLGPPDGETRLLHILAHAEAHCEGNIVEYVEGSIRRSGNVQRTQQGGYTGTAAAIAGISAAAGE